MKSNYDGVKYYGINDLTLGIYLDKSEKIIRNNPTSSKIDDINSILELYNIYLIFKSGSRFQDWSEDTYNKLKSSTLKFMPIISSYFSKINSDNLRLLYSKISNQYIDDFWCLFDKYNIFENITNETFENFLNYEKVHLSYLLKHKNLVNYFDKEIGNYMKLSNSTAELLIDYRLVEREDISIKYFLPKSLTIEQQIDIVNDYINSQSCNPNYLQIIFNSGSNKNFPIDDLMRLNAKKKYEENIDEIFNSKSGFKFGAEVEYSNTVDDVEVCSDNPLVPRFIYSSDWIKNNLDKPTLLNNFIYLFNYTDLFFRSNFPCKECEISPLEKFMGLKGIKYYKKGIVFSQKEILYSLQIIAYENELKKYNVEIESLFKWFFEDYLNNEFGVYGFTFSPFSKNSTYLEKVRILCSEMDSLLKQFNSYVNYNTINRELIEISLNSVPLDKIPSFLSNKYGYISDPELIGISNLLYSNQSIINHNSTETKQDNFDKLLTHKKLKISDFSNYQIENLIYLKCKNIIYEDCCGYLKLNNELCNILKDFYYNEVLCLNYYKDKKVIDSLIYDKKIIIENKLFSRPEQNYMNYVLNNRKYDNGLSIRNRYLHGSNTDNISDHKKDYYTILKVFVLIIIKINEEFCLREKLLLEN